MKTSRFLSAGLAAGMSFLILSSSMAMASPTLQSGSHGHDVLLLQKKLQNVGYGIQSTDGIYGEETERAVAEFQRDQKIHITGVVNNATWRALQKAKKRSWGSDVPRPPHQSSAETGSSRLSRDLAPNNEPILSQGKVSSLLQTAKSYIGVPYKFGGTTPKAFDCSGYLQYVFAGTASQFPGQPMNSTSSACARKAASSLCQAIWSSSQPMRPVPRTVASIWVMGTLSMPAPARAYGSIISPTVTGHQSFLVASIS